MLMVIAFMALSVPMITGALALSGTLSKDSTVKTEILKRQYSALGGDQFGTDMANSWDTSSETNGPHTITAAARLYNGETVNVTADFTIN